MELDIDIPADLDQFRRDNSHGAVVGGKGLVQLRHGPANGRRLLHEMHIKARISQVQGSLHAANAAANDHDRALDRLVRLILHSKPHVRKLIRPNVSFRTEHEMVNIENRANFRQALFKVQSA